MLQLADWLFEVTSQFTMNVVTMGGSGVLVTGRVA